MSWFFNKSFELLEPYEGKLSRTVLRRGKGSNPFSLVDYCSSKYQKMAKAHGFVSSMSRKGNCWDNSPTERVFRSLKYEQLNYERFKTREEAKLSVIDYFAFYNGRRSHSKLGYKTPLEFERGHYKKAA